MNDEACVAFLQRALRTPLELEGGERLIGIEHGPRGATQE